MPLNVFNMDDAASIPRIISGERVGTFGFDSARRGRWPRLRT